MENLYQQKYRITSARATWWDYKNEGLYFITICTQNKQHYFGKILKGTMHLSGIGHIVQQQWVKTAEIRCDMNLTLGEFVVMPNHFHAIIGIGKNKYNEHSIKDVVIPNRRDTMHCVSTEGAKNRFGPQSKNLASIIRGFKSSVTSRALLVHADFKWQKGFHDHIIKNDTSHQNIAKYIEENTRKWEKDIFYIK